MRAGRGRAILRATPALAVVALVLLSPSLGALPSTAARVGNGATDVEPGIVIAPFGATVTWNGHDISNASSPSSAFSLARGQTALVAFSFAGVNSGSVTNATLAVTYLGIVIGTSRTSTTIKSAVQGSATINWSFGNLYDALEGVFRLTATLAYGNGTTAFSESFYVFAKAPYLLESGAVIIFLALGGAEIYWGISSIRDARRARKPAPPTPWQGATPAAGSAAAPGPGTTAGPPTGGRPPPSGPEAPPPTTGGNAGGGSP